MCPSSGSKRLEQRRKIRCRGRLPLHRPPRHGMDQSEPPGVKRLAVERESVSPAISRISNQRMLQRRHVNANLVRAAGLEPAARAACTRRSARAARNASPRACPWPRRPSPCASPDGVRSARRRFRLSRPRRERAQGTRAAPFAPGAGAPDRAARPRSLRRPGARWCPCRGGARCPRAPPRRVRARDAGARWRACRRGCRCQGAPPARRACR